MHAQRGQILQHKKMTIAILSSSKKLALKMPDFLVTASNLLSFYKKDIRKGITFTDIKCTFVLLQA